MAAIVAVLIGLRVLLRTWTLLREAGQVLMQDVPAGLDLDEVRDMMLAHPGVGAVHDLRAWALGSKEPTLTAHVALQEGAQDAFESRSLWRLMKDLASSRQPFGLKLAHAMTRTRMRDAGSEVQRPPASIVVDGIISPTVLTAMVVLLAASGSQNIDPGERVAHV